MAATSRYVENRRLANLIESGSELKNTVSVRTAIPTTPKNRQSNMVRMHASREPCQVYTANPQSTAVRVTRSNKEFSVPKVASNTMQISGIAATKHTETVRKRQWCVWVIIIDQRMSSSGGGVRVNSIGERHGSRGVRTKSIKFKTRLNSMTRTTLNCQKSSTLPCNRLFVAYSGSLASRHTNHIGYGHMIPNH